MYTHDWSIPVDTAHLSEIQANADELAPGGVRHLILEVVAYAADEAEDLGGGHCTITFHADGSISIADRGRGTVTELTEDGPVRKPVMASKDLRYFDVEDSPLLPDGHRMRGMSVVAALSDWLVHTNRRQEGAWTQRYHHGIPDTELESVPVDGTTGTTVHFLPDKTLSAGEVSIDELARAWPYLTVEIRHADGDEPISRSSGTP